jgi:hypothetical protein
MPKHALRCQGWTRRDGSRGAKLGVRAEVQEALADRSTGRSDMVRTDAGTAGWVRAVGYRLSVDELQLCIHSGLDSGGWSRPDVESGRRSRSDEWSDDVEEKPR